MTTPRDPLVVIANLRNALDCVEWKGPEVDRGIESCPWCTHRKHAGHARDCVVGLALSASAPMPAPERVGVEEVMKLVEKCVQVHRKWERGEANAGMCNDCTKALESAVRRLGGGA